MRLKYVIIRRRGRGTNLKLKTIDELVAQYYSILRVWWSQRLTQPKEETMQYPFQVTWLIATCWLGSSGSKFSKIFGNNLMINSTGSRMCLTDTSQYLVTLAQTKLHCALECSRNLDWLQFNFYEDSRRCEMYSNLGGRNCSSTNRLCSNYRVSYT